MHRLDLISLADTVTACASPEEAWEAFAGHLAREGVERAQLQLDLPWRAANPFADDPDARCLGVFWDAALDAEVRGHRGDIRRTARPELLHIRPTLLFLSRFRSPFFMDHRHMVETAPASPFAPICRIMLEEMGQHHALVLPLADPSGGRFSSLTLWTAEHRPDFAALAGAREGAWQMAALHLKALMALRFPIRERHETGERLSDRQRQVLALLAAGAQVSEIADRLAITERSVHEYLRRARATLGARTRTETVALALLRGLL